MHTSERADRAARRLRRDTTYGEGRLWKALRKVEGHRFRRQAPMGPYVVDFVCHASRLVIEVDGGIHALDVVRDRDRERDLWLNSRGYQVLRIADRDATLAPEAVVEVILAAISSDTPTPNPSPQGGGELK